MFTTMSYSCLFPGVHGSKQENNMLFKKYIEIGGVTCAEPRLLSQDPGKFLTMLHPTWITIYYKKYYIAYFKSIFFLSQFWKKMLYFNDKEFLKIYIRAPIFWAWGYLNNARKFQSFPNGKSYAFTFLVTKRKSCY